VLRRAFLFIVPLICWLSAIPAQDHRPVADSGAVVMSDKVRFTLLGPRVVRMEYAPDGVFEDRATLTFVTRKVQVPRYTTRNIDGWLEIKTEALLVRYKLGSGPFGESNLSIQFSTGGIEGVWFPGKPNKGNLRGTTRTLDGTDGDLVLKDSSRLQLESGLISRDGWVLIEDSSTPVFDNSDWPWVTARPAKNQQDLYFFAYGYDYKRALKDFTSIAGKIALPPRFAFGYWYSRWRSYSEAELRELIGTFESLDIPLDVLVIDMDWHLTSLPEFFENGVRKRDQAGENFGWTGFTWNRDYFPDPEGFLAWAKMKGLKISLNLHPASGIQPHEEQYVPMAKAMGIDPASKRYIPFDIVNKDFAEKYFDIVIHPLEKKGVDFWWLDWQQWNTTTIPGVNPTFYLNYVHYTDMLRQDKVRPFIYHRWGGLGNHRYQIGFSGDAKISWKSLAFQPYFTATAANVGFGYWGNDIGGFYGDPNTPEQFERWFQFGIFSPIVKTHATSRNFSILRKLWEYPPETFLRLRELVRSRYALIPYIYTAARFAYDEGISLCHPVYFEDPKHDESYRYPNEYMFGNDMLVHPITHPMGKDSLFTFQETWLPEGDWFELASGTILKGNRSVRRSFGAQEIPVYIKSGAIIPTQPPMRHTGERPVDPLILTFYPGERGTARLYEDEGNTGAYLNGNHAFSSFRFDRNGTTLVAALEPVQGTFSGMPASRRYELRFPNTFPPRHVFVNGRETAHAANGAIPGWSYDGSNLSTVVSLESHPVTAKVEVRIEFTDGRVERLSGTKRRFDALYRFSKFLADHRSFRKQDVWNDGKYSSDLVVAAAQTGNRIAKTPLSINEELDRFDQRWEQIVAIVSRLGQEQRMFLPYLDLFRHCD
jgi:alpha-glucosidase (family GH31 glycosyl hydrolase)